MGLKKVTDRQKKYRAYLMSPEWAAFRRLAYDHYGTECNKCGSKTNLNIHHHHYRNVFKETLADVVVLCKVCHGTIHGKTPKNKLVRKIGKRARKKARQRALSRSNNNIRFSVLSYKKPRKW